jgi:hypothetical protein
MMSDDPDDFYETVIERFRQQIQQMAEGDGTYEVPQTHIEREGPCTLGWIEDPYDEDSDDKESCDE